jgi:hypothetical protein
VPLLGRLSQRVGPRRGCKLKVGYQPEYPVNGDMYPNHGVAPERLYRSPANSVSQANPSPVLYDPPSKPQQPSQPNWEPPPENGSTAPGSDDDDEDPLNPTQMNAPFDNMLSLAEAARLKADGHMNDQPKNRSPVKRPASNIPFDFGSPGHPAKKRRSTRAGAELELGLQMPYPVERGDKMHAFPDVVDLGFCTTEKGKQLVDL